MNLIDMKRELARSLQPQMRALLARDPKNLETAHKFLDRDTPNLWEAALAVGAFMNGDDVTAAERERAVELITQIRELQGELARTSREPASVVFGTSGWRDVIGEGFTVFNVHKVVRGIIRMMHSREFLDTNQMADVEEVKRAGILLLRDNRYMGDEFISAAEAELAAVGFTIMNAGECPTGVGSALVTELGAAGSINFTPSHNPMEYAGIKFNPKDGGPADLNLTTIIEREAATFMLDPSFEPAPAPSAPSRRIDGATMYRDFIEKKSSVFDLAAIRRWLTEQRKDLFILVDNMHGASRGYLETLLGDDTMQTLRETDSIRFVNTNDDYSFHGVKPEPSAKNQKPLIEELKKSGRRFTLAAALDPDADRIRCADANLDVDMNRFGAIAYANLLAKGMRRGVASTVPSSDFALEIAKQNEMKVVETEVGFKFFRPPLSANEVLVAFEESDGISFYAHTLEKDAVAGFLAAIDSMATSGKTLSEQYEELRARYGYFYPDKAGADVRGVSVDEWQRYKNAVLRALTGGMFRVGQALAIGSTERTIANINTLDGLKLIFDDKSWLLLRPSGTEPKFRYYFEVASTTPLPDVQERLDAYQSTAAEILQRARSEADSQLEAGA